MAKREPDLLCQHHNDHGNAERLITLHGHDLRYYHAIKRWLIHDGTRWQIDETGQAYKLAKKTMLRLLAQAAEGNHKDAESFAKSSLNHKRIAAMMASTECELPIRTLDLDRNAYLINCLNGTLDLETGELRAHCREDYITKLAHLEYKPDADCPLFLQFLRRIMGDGPDASQADGERAGRLAGYLQKVFGYSLTGDVSEKVIFCFFGNGNNGKTTLLEAIRFVLWEYSAQIQIDTLMSHRQRESNASLSDLADLRGARFVTTSEAEQGGRLAEGKLKYLSAGMGEVKTCRKYENPITFQAAHKLFIDANHKPIVRGTDQAVWNRLKLIPFDVTIPPEEIDKGLLEKLKSEAEGVLAWMVEGCRRWLAEGLGDPPEVTEASAGWRSEMSLLTEFIEDRCELSPQGVCPVGELRQSYESWARKNGEREAVWVRAFDDELTARGCLKKRERIAGKQARVWLGISLRTDEDAC
jgi:putative DNA primase/helicase